MGKGGGKIVILHFIPLLGKTTTQVVSFYFPDLEKFALFGGRSRPNKWTLDFSFFGLVFLGKAKRYHNKKEWGGRIIFLFSSFAAKVFFLSFFHWGGDFVLCVARARNLFGLLSLWTVVIRLVDSASRAAATERESPFDNNNGSNLWFTQEKKKEKCTDKLTGD